MYRGEIYLIDLSHQTGSAQNGIRPAVIVQNNVGNLYSPTTIVCPLTTQAKTMSATHVVLNTSDADIVKNSTVLCEQVQVIDKSRLIRKLGKVNNMRKIEDINQKILVSFGIKGDVSKCTTD